MSEDQTIKCPYCLEDIKDGAKICKHCSKDLTTFEAQKDINDRKLENLKEEVKEKVAKYPKRILLFGKKSNKRFLKKLSGMSQEEVEEDVFKKTRNQNIFLLWFIILFLFPSYPYLIILAVWLHPDKDERKIFVNRFNNFNGRKLRIFFSFFTLLMAFSYHQSQLEYAEEERLRQEKIERQESTVMSVDLGLEREYTSKEKIDLIIEISNIKDLSVNDYKIDINGQNKLKHTVDLEMGENKIKIIGYNNDIKREITKNVERLSEEEYEKLIQEEKKKTEEKKAKQTNVEVEIPDYVLLDKVEHISTRRHQDKAIYFGDILIKKELNEIKNPEEFSKIAKKIVEEENLKKSASFYTTKEAYKANYNSTIENADSFLHEGYIGTFEDGKFTTLQSSKYFKLHNTN